MPCTYGTIIYDSVNLMKAEKLGGAGLADRGGVQESTVPQCYLFRIEI